MVQLIFYSDKIVGYTDLSNIQVSIKVEYKRCNCQLLLTISNFPNRKIDLLLKILIL